MRLLRHAPLSLARFLLKVPAGIATALLPFLASENTTASIPGDRVARSIIKSSCCKKTIGCGGI